MSLLVKEHCIPFKPTSNIMRCCVYHYSWCQQRRRSSEGAVVKPNALGSIKLCRFEQSDWSIGFLWNSIVLQHSALF